MKDKIQISVNSDLKEFLPSYLENRKKDLQTLIQAIERGDFKTVETISHKVRGHALSYGFDKLSTICTMMEKAARDQMLEPIVSLLNEYRDYIENIEIN